jgi:hypothetical protein
MSSQTAPLSSQIPAAVAPAGNKPGNVPYTNNPMGKPAAEAKPAGPGMFDWLFSKPKQPLSSIPPGAIASGGRRRRGSKKTQRKRKAKKTRKHKRSH